jgi:DNA invertase Pin-like site-specific DNA recombinase
MKRRVGIYLRVSTDGQTTENERRELEAVAARGFDRLLKDATARKINMIAAWSVDRLGRSLQHLVGFLNELQALSCSPFEVRR